MSTDEKKEEVGGAAAAPAAPAAPAADASSAASMLQKEMVVEEGQSAGDKIKLPTPWGQEVEIEIPAGKVPGDKYIVEVALPPGVVPPQDAAGGQRTFSTEITVPDDAVAGDTLKVKLPWGQVIDVAAPEGAKPGDTFGIKVPVPPGVQGGPGGGGGAHTAAAAAQ